MLFRSSSAHPFFKQKILESKDGDTFLSLKKVGPVRVLRNPFYDRVKGMEENGASAEELLQTLGKGRAKKGMFEGNLDEGELEIGQISALISEIRPAAEIVKEIMEEFYRVKSEVASYL